MQIRGVRKTLKKEEISKKINYLILKTRPLAKARVEKEIQERVNENYKKWCALLLKEKGIKVGEYPGLEVLMRRMLIIENIIRKDDKRAVKLREHVSNIINNIIKLQSTKK